MCHLGYLSSAYKVVGRGTEETVHTADRARRVGAAVAVEATAAAIVRVSHSCTVRRGQTEFRPPLARHVLVRTGYWRLVPWSNLTSQEHDVRRSRVGRRARSTVELRWPGHGLA